MKITHALKLAEELTEHKVPTSEERAAVRALVSFVKQVRAARPAIRRLADIIDPETHLNQQVMFEEPAANQEPTDE